MVEITVVKLSNMISFQKKLLNFVSLERKIKTISLKNEQDKKQSLISELLIRKTASDYLNVPMEQLKISYNPYGKPYIDNIRHFNFNISHSDDFVVIATSKYHVGIDIEKVKQINIDIAKRFFTNKEYEYISSFQSEKEKEFAFYQLWTLKESYVKALGQGISIPLNSFEVFMENSVITVNYNNKKNYHFYTTKINEYILSVTFQNERINKQYNLLKEKDFYNTFQSNIIC